jgi:hypothetical protein
MIRCYMLNASAFRTIRRRMLSQRLTGFKESDGGVYRRLRDGQLHVFEIAARKYGGGFTVDVGLHFEGVPLFPPYSGQGGATACAFNQRLRLGQSQFWDYGESTADAEAAVGRVAQMALDAFEHEARWETGAPLLAALPPAVIREDAAIFSKLRDAPTAQEQSRLSACMTMRRLLPAWCPLPGSTTLLLAHLARAHGRPFAMVGEYLSLLDDDPGGGGPPWQALARALTSL